MDEETTVTPASEEQTETVETTEEVEEVVDEKTIELEKERKARKDTELRAKKAEDELKRLKAQSEKKEPSNELSNKDVLFLAKADVHEDDLDTVLEWAKFKNISVAEAHKQLKTTLDVRAEERRTAEASNVSNVRRGTAKVSDDVLVSNASRNKLPESDEDIERLIAAKLKAK